MVSPAFLCDSKVKSEKSFRLQSMQSYMIKVEAPRPIRGTGQERMLPDRTPRYRAVCEHFVYLPLGIVLDWPNLGGGWSPGNDLVNASLSHSR